MWRELFFREIGRHTPQKVAATVQTRRTRCINLSREKEIINPFKAGITALQIDPVESRYLLAGAADGSLSAYDVQQTSQMDATGGVARHTAIFTVARGTPDAHRFKISAALWYPVDTGLFVTASFDHKVNLWDTNTLQVEVQFGFSGKVYAAAMSECASQHSLIAVGSQDHTVQLCDAASGAISQTLSAHRDAVLATQWSPTSEWQLASGASDGTICLWDVRRSEAPLHFDSQTAAPQGQPRGRVGEGSAFPGSVQEQGLPSRVRERPKPAGPDKWHRQSSASRAHDSPVCALEFTADGLYLLSSGGEGRLRLWDVGAAANTLVNYPTPPSKSRCSRLAMSPQGPYAFYPAGSSIVVYHLWSGQQQAILQGHYEAVSCVSFNPEVQVLYSGGSDRQILVWGPESVPPDLDEGPAKQANLAGTLDDTDNWSDYSNDI